MIVEAFALLFKIDKTLCGSCALYLLVHVFVFLFFVFSRKNHNVNLLSIRYSKSGQVPFDVRFSWRAVRSNYRAISLIYMGSRQVVDRWCFTHQWAH